MMGCANSKHGRGGPHLQGFAPGIGQMLFPACVVNCITALITGKTFTKLSRLKRKKNRFSVFWQICALKHKSDPPV